MTNKVHTLGADLIQDLDYILGITLEGAVPGSVKRGYIRVARADVVEQNYLVFINKQRDYLPPHVLIAAISVSKHESTLARTKHLYVIATQYLHAGLRGIRDRNPPPVC
jgi:hypothetical protein